MTTAKPNSMVSFLSVCLASCDIQREKSNLVLGYQNYTCSCGEKRKKIEGFGQKGKPFVFIWRRNTSNIYSGVYHSSH